MFDEGIDSDVFRISMELEKEGLTKELSNPLIDVAQALSTILRGDSGATDQERDLIKSIKKTDAYKEMSTRPHPERELRDDQGPGSTTP